MASFSFSKSTLVLSILCMITSLLLLFYAHIFGYTLHIGKIRPFYLTNLRYTRAKRAVVTSCSRVEIRFHLPRPSNPRWATFIAYDYEFQNADHHVSLAKVNATLWVFPLLCRLTAGPWISAQLDDFRVRIFSSRATPRWVEELRVNLIATILHGETLRCNSLKTGVTFSPAIGEPDDARGGGNGEKEPQDDIRVTVSSEQWNILNFRSRMYTFGKLDAQLRKRADDMGTFALIATESRWTKVPRLKQEQTFTNPHWLWLVFRTIAHLPVGVWDIYRDPMSTLDLYVTRIDVTFDAFRIRDSHLPHQVGGFLKMKLDESRESGILEGLTWDTFFRSLLQICT